jgi:hypothetical protein
LFLSINCFNFWLSLLWNWLWLLFLRLILTHLMGFQYWDSSLNSFDFLLRGLTFLKSPLDIFLRPFQLLDSIVLAG